MPQIHLEQTGISLQPRAEHSSLHAQAFELLTARPTSLLGSSDTGTRNSPAEVNSTTPAQRGFAEKLEQFASKNFDAIDDNKDKYLSRTEVKLYALRRDLSAEDKAMTSFILNNYEDLNQLTDARGRRSFRWNNLNPKDHPELTMNDFTMLRVVSDATQRQKALQEKQGQDRLFDYCHLTTYGALGGLSVAGGIARMLGPRAGVAALLIGAAGGALGGYGLASYFRSNYYTPGCQNYYDEKRDLSKKILDPIGR